MEMLVMTRLHLTPCWLEVKPSSWAAANNAARLGRQKRRWGPAKTFSYLSLLESVTPVNVVAEAKYKGVRGNNCKLNLSVCVFLSPLSHHCSDHLLVEHNASSHPKMLFWHSQPEHYHHHQYPTPNSSYLR